MSQNASPPSPQECPATTARAAFVAMAASTAEPPRAQDADPRLRGEVMRAGHGAVDATDHGHRHLGRQAIGHPERVGGRRRRDIAGTLRRMFATVIGPYPQVDGTSRERLVATIGDQLEAGLGMLSDGLIHDAAATGADSAVGAWRAADEIGHHLAAEAGIDPPLIKACLVGPWSAGYRDARQVAGHLVPVIRALFDAGAPVVQLTESALCDIEPDDHRALERLEVPAGVGHGGCRRPSQPRGRWWPIDPRPLRATALGTVRELPVRPHPWTGRLAAVCPRARDERPYRGCRGRPHGRSGHGGGEHLGRTLRGLARGSRPDPRGPHHLGGAGAAAAGRRPGQAGGPCRSGPEGDVTGRRAGAGHRPTRRRRTVRGPRSLRAATTPRLTTCPCGAGSHPGAASSNPSNRNPGDTVQPTRGRSPRLRATCQSPQGTTIWGRSPPTRSMPSRWCVAGVRPSRGAMDSSRGAPV